MEFQGRRQREHRPDVGMAEMMMRESSQKNGFVTLAALCLLTICNGCATTRPPTPREFDQIVTAIRADEAAIKAKSPYSQPAGFLDDASPVDIRIDGKRAVANYVALGSGQIALVRMKTVLDHVSMTDWAVHSVTVYPPWWWQKASVSTRPEPNPRENPN